MSSTATTSKPTPDDTVLAVLKKRFTLAQWKDLRKELQSSSAGTEKWVEAFNVLRTRWETRYLHPIGWIHDYHGAEDAKGEGFAIMTIACCLLENVAAAYFGRIYHYGFQPGHKSFAPWGYHDPKEFYEKMLRLHPDFRGKVLCPDFNEQRFYRAIRCGLIHEARTKAELKIQCNSSTADLLQVEKNSVVVNRHAFVTRINCAIKRMEADVLSGTRISKVGNPRHNLARVMDWTFGMFDHHEPSDALKGDSMPWWNADDFKAGILA